MDSSDIQISFDEKGVCDHCRGFYKDVLPNWNPSGADQSKLTKIIEQIKLSGKNKEFDSIIGLSGGLDSSYLLHLVVSQYKLRPLVFHVDGGWNTDIAVNNVQMLVDKLGLDLYTEVKIWKIIRVMKY